MLKIFITGGTGFVGKEIVKRLTKENVEIFMLVRNKSKSVPKKNIESIQGDILKPSTYEKSLKKCDVLINIVGIIREIPKRNITFENLHVKAVRNLIETAKNSGVQKIIHMSANGARKDAVSNYHKTKFLGETLVENSGITYTIFKPSVIYGQGDEFINMVAAFMKKTPVFSYFGNGKQPMQPVSVEEVSEIFVKSIYNKETDNKKFNVCGNKILTYKELLELIIITKKFNKLLIPVPVSIIKLLTILFDKFENFPLTKEQLIMLLEGNTCEEREIFNILQIEEQNIEEKLSEYL